MWSVCRSIFASIRHVTVHVRTRIATFTRARCRRVLCVLRFAECIAAPRRNKRRSRLLHFRYSDERTGDTRVSVSPGLLFKIPRPKSIVLSRRYRYLVVRQSTFIQTRYVHGSPVDGLPPSRSYFRVQYSTSGDSGRRYIITRV